jgi:hypothetical protein
LYSLDSIIVQVKGMFETVLGPSTAGDVGGGRPFGGSEFELPQPDSRGHFVDSVFVRLLLGGGTFLEPLDLTGLLLTSLSEPGDSLCLLRLDRA